MFDTQKEFYTISEICKLFRITRQTVYKLEKKNILVPFKIGKIRRFKKEHINKIINQNEIRD